MCYVHEKNIIKEQNKNYDSNDKLENMSDYFYFYFLCMHKINKKKTFYITIVLKVCLYFEIKKNKIITILEMNKICKKIFINI